MKNSPQKWIWQHSNYPHFKYDKTSLVELLIQIEYHHGILYGISKSMNQKDLQSIKIEALVNEAMNTSAIEGEYLKRESVRASFYKKLLQHFNARNDTSTHQTDALVEVLIDCSTNQRELTQERLHAWHNCLFVASYDFLHKIRIASFREDDDMQVVSGPIGHEKVHYVAPPAKLIDKDIEALLEWIENNDENRYIKSALAHLWFVSIHPYDDGNGRIARAITDYILSGISQVDFKLYSLSTAIYHKRTEYYAMLDKTTNIFMNRDFDFTAWIRWHLETVMQAMIDAQKELEYLLEKTKFWDAHRSDALNPRQVKVLNKILDMGQEKFEGGINTKKYMAITKISKATAVRDIQELLSKGCIVQIEGSSGRNIRYEIVV